MAASCKTFIKKTIYRPGNRYIFMERCGGVFFLSCGLVCTFSLPPSINQHLSFDLCNDKVLNEPGEGSVDHAKASQLFVP